MPCIPLIRCGFLAIAGVTAVSPAMAQDRAWNGSVSALGLYAPDYEGSDDYRFLPNASLRLQTGDFYLQTEGSGFVANVVPSPHFIAGPAFNYRFGRDRHIESAPVKALGKIGWATELGGFAGVRGFDLLREGDVAELRAKYLRDVSDVHDGSTIETSLDYQVPLAGAWRAGLGASLTYADASYTRRYFGIDAAGAAASGLSAYRPDGGIKDAGARVTLTYSVTQSWGLIGYAGYTRLLGDARRSPIVAREGSPNQFAIGLGAFYNF